MKESYVKEAKKLTQTGGYIPVGKKDIGKKFIVLPITFLKIIKQLFAKQNEGLKKLGEILSKEELKAVRQIIKDDLSLHDNSFLGGYKIKVLNSYFADLEKISDLDDLQNISNLLIGTKSSIVKAKIDKYLKQIPFFVLFLFF